MCAPACGSSGSGKHMGAFQGTATGIVATAFVRTGIGDGK